MTRCHASLLIAVIVIFLNPESAYARFPLKQIMITGQPALNAEPAEFILARRPAINSHGDVSFGAGLLTNDPSRPKIGHGDYAQFGPTDGPSSPLGVVARIGDAVEGGNSGEYFEAFAGFSALSDAGDVAFRANYFKPDEGQLSSLFGPTSGAGSSLGIVARAGEPVPGAAAGSVFEYFPFSPPVVNSNGDLAFIAEFSSPSNRFDSGILGPVSGVGSPLGLILKEGDPAPGAGDDVVFDGFERYFIPSLNNSGDIAFVARVIPCGGIGSASGAIFGPTAGPGSPLGRLLGDGDQVFDTNGDALMVRALFAPALNDVGDIAALVSNAIVGPSSGPGSQLGVVVRAGDRVPGTPDGIVFRDFSLPSLNNLGDVAFRASFQEASDLPGADVDNALFATVDGVLQMILREGDVIPVIAPDGTMEERTIKELERLQPTSALFGGSKELNDNGILVATLAFDDGSHGVFTIDTRAVPEHPGVAYLVAGAFLCLWLAERRSNAGQI